jgi:D-alanyl-D-alanine carboxypeptidase
MKLSRRSRWVLGAAAVCVLVLGGVAFLNHGPSIVIPDHPCADPPPLRTHDGATLQPVAMQAFRKAERTAHTTIAISASFRSCAQQAIACRDICGDPHGCPGRCAQPGSSYHQLGAAVDLTQGSLDNAAIVSAMKSAGWCEPLPSSDPGHFSYGGCH